MPTTSPARKPESPPALRPPHLGRILVTLGALTPADLDWALDRQEREGGRLGTCLLDLDLIDEPTLLAGLGAQLHVPTASREELAAVAPDAALLLPARAARFALAVPLGQSAGRLEVAMMDPSSLDLVDALVSVARQPIVPRLALEIRIREALERLYGLPSDARIERTRTQLERRRNGRDPKDSGDAN